MKKPCFKSFYRVFTNGTNVTEVSFNNFTPPVISGYKKMTEPLQVNILSLLAEKDRYAGYKLRTQAMEMAKKGALEHLTKLISQGVGRNDDVYQYRFDHYDDLNFNLTDINIRKFKKLENEL